MLEPSLALELRRTLELLLLPPGGMLVLVLFGLWLSVHRPRAGRTLIGLGLLASWLLATPMVAQALIRAVEAANPDALDAAALRALMRDPQRPQAVVILGGGIIIDRRERPLQAQPHPRTRDRLMHGAWVARVTGLPVLVSGGVPPHHPVSEAAVMKHFLEQRLGTAVRWVEDGSLDTADNARRSAALLKEQGYSRVLLVTHAYHMPRSAWTFARAGLQVTPAPHGFMGTPAVTAGIGWLPTAEAAVLSRLAIHETVGWLWYRLRDH